MPTSEEKPNLTYAYTPQLDSLHTMSTRCNAWPQVYRLPYMGSYRKPWWRLCCHAMNTYTHTPLCAATACVNRAACQPILHLHPTLTT